LKSEYLSSISWNFDGNVHEMIRTASSMEEAVHVFDENVQLPNEFLTMIDFLSMNFSVEARTPFLDKNFSDLMRSIPFELRCTPKDYKSLLVNSVGSFMPKSALGHAKSGFSLPLSVLMRKTMRGLFDKLMSKECLESAGFYDGKIYPELIEPFLRGDNRFVALVWRVFFLQFWVSQTVR
jgi:asparagine synthase (glutamine-hydrolysing)